MLEDISRKPRFFSPRGGNLPYLGKVREFLDYMSQSGLITGILGGLLTGGVSRISATALIALVRDRLPQNLPLLEKKRIPTVAKQTLLLD